MASNTTPVFTLTPRSNYIKTTGANTALDGTGSNVMTIYTAGNNGSTFENFHVKALGTSTAGMIRVFLNDGSSYFLIHEIPVNALTQSSTQTTFEADWVPPNTLWTLPSGYSIRGTTHNADAAYNLGVNGGDF